MYPGEIQRHVEESIGPIDRVLHEIVSDGQHVDVLVVAPTSARNFITLVTSGMSAIPMRPPPQMELARHCEVCVCLPPDWRLDPEALKDERNYWPVRWLKTLARLPSAEEPNWVWEGHTIANGEPPKPFSDGTKLCALTLIRPIHFPQGFHSLKLGNSEDTIDFFMMAPLLETELVFKAKNGFDALLDKLRLGDAVPILNPARRPVCADDGLDPFGNIVVPGGRSDPVRRTTPGRVVGFVLFLPLLIFIWLVSSVIVWRKVKQWAVPIIKDADFGAAMNEDAGVLREYERTLIAGGFTPSGDFLLECSPAETESGRGAAVRFYFDGSHTTQAYIAKMKTGASVLTFFELSTAFDDGYGLCSSSLDSPMWHDRSVKTVRQYPGRTIDQVMAAHEEEVGVLSAGRAASRVDDVKADFLDGARRDAARKEAAGMIRIDSAAGIGHFTLRGALAETARQWLFMTLGVNPLRRV